MVTSRRGYLSDDRCAVVLVPDGGGGTLARSGAASITPAAFCHPRQQQTGSTGGQLTTARANQRDFSNLVKGQKASCNIGSKPLGTSLSLICCCLYGLSGLCSYYASEMNTGQFLSNLTCGIAQLLLEPHHTLPRKR